MDSTLASYDLTVIGAHDTDDGFQLEGTTEEMEALEARAAAMSIDVVAVAGKVESLAASDPASVIRAHGENEKNPEADRDAEVKEMLARRKEARALRSQAPPPVTKEEPRKRGQRTGRVVGRSISAAASSVSSDAPPPDMASAQQQAEQFSLLMSMIRGLERALADQQTEIGSLHLRLARAEAEIVALTQPTSRAAPIVTYLADEEFVDLGPQDSASRDPSVLSAEPVRTFWE